MQHEKHGIHKVDKNLGIVVEEVNVDEFAVQIRISRTRQIQDTFKDEARRHFDHLKGMTGNGIPLSELVASNFRVTFIHGIAGMGKTVLSKQLTYGWASNKIFSNFKLCIMVECRDINSFVADRKISLNKHELFNDFLKTKFNIDLGGGEGILFIVDGIDELFDIYKDDSIIWQLLDINNSSFALSKIIVTGRPNVQYQIERTAKGMGGFRKFEIQGLTDKEIEHYIKKFVSCDEDVMNIGRAKESSRQQLPILHVPQFLNSFCCVAILSKGSTIRNAAELYCWTLYLLLKQHVEKEGPSGMRSSDVFKDYLKEIMTLCKICHELLSENKIILEGGIQSCLSNGGKGEDFLAGLFVDVSDNRKKRCQFKHLSLMEFLSAVYVCHTSITSITSIKQSLKNRFYEVVLLSCQLIVGCQYDGIIRDLFGGENVTPGNIPHTLKSIMEDTIEYLGRGEESFQLLIDIVMCFFYKDIISKQLAISTLRGLPCKMKVLFKGSMQRVSDISEQLENEYNCKEEDLKSAFTYFLAKWVKINNIKSLISAKYLPNVEKLDVYFLNTKASFIRSEVNKISSCKEVEIADCVLEDDSVDDETAQSTMELLWIYESKLDRASFINVCRWVASSFKWFSLWDMDTLEYDWCQVLVDAIIIEKEKGNRRLKLERLDVFKCTQRMSQEMEMTVRQTYKYSS